MPFGDYCGNCNQPCGSCTCECGCNNECAENEPCLPGPDGSECKDWLKAECVFWMGDDIPGTPIKKGVRLTEIITYLLARIANHEGRIVALEP